MDEVEQPEIADASAPPGYAMVPVPEEHVPAVRRYLDVSVRINDGQESWTAETVGRLLDRLDDLGRTVLESTARASRDESTVSVGEIAAAAGCSRREVLGTITEMMTLATDVVEKPQPVMLPVRVNDDEADLDWVLVTSPLIATAVLDARAGHQSP